MAVAEEKSGSDGKVWSLCRIPFWHSGSNPQYKSSVSSVARSLLPTRRRLRLDPATKLYFPCECVLFVNL